MIQFLFMIIYPTPLQQDAAQGHFFQQNYCWFEFSIFPLLDWLPHLLFTNSYGGRKDGIMPFSRAFAWSQLPIQLRLKNTLIASLQRGKTLPTSVLSYDTKQSDGEVPILRELWGMQHTSSLQLLPGPLWSGVVAPDRILSLGQIELNCVLMLNWTAWNRTVLIFKLHIYSKQSCLK